MTEIHFIVEDAPKGGYLARALGESIYTEAYAIDTLHQQVRDAMHCHFNEGQAPHLIRLHFTHEDALIDKLS